MQEFLAKLVLEGGRIFWTAVEALVGVLVAYSVPEDLLDFAGAYEPAIVGGIVIGVAVLATFLKEKARDRLS